MSAPNPQYVMDAVAAHLKLCDNAHDDPRSASYAICLAALMQCATHSHSLDSILSTIREHHGAAITAAAKAARQY